jgi:predicted RNA-binding Zn-ribbon protein involved in translation (DUF1610 family)
VSRVSARRATFPAWIPPSRARASASAPFCVDCGRPLIYVRQDRQRGVLEHRYECGKCGQRHAAWSYDWEVHPLRKAEEPAPP